nr:hypothetical protein [Microtetraspora niveoalba]
MRAVERRPLALSAHILRHTLATNLLRAGVDIVVVDRTAGLCRAEPAEKAVLIDMLVTC